MTARLGRPRVLAFIAVTAVSVVVAVGYVAAAALRDRSGPSADESGVATRPADDLSLQAIAERPRLAFLNLSAGNVGHLAVLPLDDLAGPRLVAEVQCDRLYQAAARGLCLVTEPGIALRYWLLVLDAGLHETARLELTGPPSRTRISADGRYGATTVFEFGHSYADNDFSTATWLIDLATGTKVDALESFALYRGEERVHAADLNYWGVTFADDSNVFYATVRTAGRTHLVKGDVARRELRIVRDNVECPSLSPDGTRLGYKKLVGGPGEWRFTVLDLATMRETPLAETESIDDQLEWLDDDTLLYGKLQDVWAVPSDGSGSGRLLLRDARSPAVLR